MLGFQTTPPGPPGPYSVKKTHKLRSLLSVGSEGIIYFFNVYTYLILFATYYGTPVIFLTIS